MKYRTHTAYGRAKAKGIVSFSFIQSHAMSLCSSSMHQFPNTHTFSPRKMGNVISKMCRCVSALYNLCPLCPSASRINSLAFNGSCSTLQPDHRPVSFSPTEYNKDSGGKWHLRTCCLTRAKLSGWKGLLVVNISAICVIYKVCVGEWRRSGSLFLCVCFPVSCLWLLLLVCLFLCGQR